MDEFEIVKLAIQQLEEGTARINKHCNEILDIMNNPFRMLMETDRLEELNLRIQAESMILSNFASALEKPAVNEEGEENGQNDV